MVPTKISPVSVQGDDQQQQRKKVHEDVASIFKRIKFMRFARLFGAFPLEFVDNNEYECLRYNTWTVVTLIIMVVVAFAIYLAEVFILRTNGLYGWTLSAEMKQQGLKTTDTVAMALLWIPNILSIFGYYSAFKAAAPDLSMLSRKVAEVPNITLNDGSMKAFMKWGWINRSFGTVLGFVICILSGVIDGLTVSPVLSSSPWIYVVAILKALLTAIILTSPMSTVTSMILGRALEVVRLIFKQYTDKIQNLAYSEADRNDIPWRREFIKTGFYITDLVLMTERSLGPIIFISFSITFVNEILAGFFGIMLFTAFSNDSFNILEFHYGLFFAVLGCWHLYMFVQLSSKCQSLTDLTKKARTMAEVIMFNEDVKLSEAEMIKLRVLMKRWSRPAALRPLDAFDVSRAMGLSLYGLLATYIIVLLQFKIGESAP